MEAVAKHDFFTDQTDEISFSKGSDLLLLELDPASNWFKAVYQGNVGLVPSNYLDVKPHPWYMLGMTRTEAENALLEKSASGAYKQQDGAFIVRPSESSPGNFSLSVKSGNSVQHFKVLSEGHQYYLWQEKFKSLNELIGHHRHHSVSRSSNICLRDIARHKVIATYNFDARDPEELKFSRGEIIVILDKKDPNWWMGEITRDNVTSRGLLPKTYVSEYTG